MHIVKLLSLLFLSLYLVVMGLQGMGMNLGFVPGAVTNFFALAAGVLFFVRAVKCCCWNDGSCHHKDMK